ncbi:MAG: GNAT family N-acetyltransferase [Merismopedia sp. SIO2A8]|nr:GNAT family N-acetyltransferase [Symploca sp. SIO2B6]NET51908.1 GNAT family N-acetyltransferase [Merismopedia sp. SIO2A8]
MTKILTVQRVTYQEAIAPIQAIRCQVFQMEQGVSSELEFDGEDETAIHFLAYQGKTAVGTARLRYIGNDSDQTPIAKIERVAVLKAYRGCGIGRSLMVEAIAYLQQQDVTHIKLSAQLSVQPFYESLGFQSVGEHFMEAGIKHITMWYYQMSPNS